MSNPTSPLDLGTLPVSKLLKQYAFPAIVAMTASSLYNMVDSIFIGHGVGPLAISGLALTFPFMNLSAAFGAMVGIGASTLISVRLGQQDYKAAQDIFGNVVTLTLILGVLFSIVALVFLAPPHSPTPGSTWKLFCWVTSSHTVSSLSTPSCVLRGILNWP